MDVSCERCQTEYEFDDALVSDQGTSVRCTQCGHKFRVKREVGNAPEIWVVRTVDGRELEFRALRDLKGAITTGRIGRDDVLSRGVGRPRRLASIAELEPFFVVPAPRIGSTASGLGDEPRPRSRTPHGLGPYQPPEPNGDRTETSVAFSLPKLAAEAAAREARAKRSESRDVGITTSTFGTPATVSVRADVQAPESLEPETFRRERKAPSAPPEPALGGEEEVTQARPRSSIPSERVRSSGLNSTMAGLGVAEAQTIEPEPRTQPRGDGRKADFPPAPSQPPVDPSDTAVTRADSKKEVAARIAAVRAAQAASPQHAPVAASEPAAPRVASRPPSSPPAKTPVPPPLAGPQVDPVAAEAPTKRPSDAPPQSADGARTFVMPEPAPVHADSDPPAPVRHRHVDRSEPPPDVRGRERTDSVPPLDGKHTPTPNEVRFSITSEDAAGSDPRFTALSVRSGHTSGSTRLIAGLLIAGALAFGAVLLVQRFVMNSGKKTDTSQDERITAYLAESDKLLRQGDLDGASDQLQQARAVNDNDLRLVKALARVANARAEFPCLKADILGDGDPEREAAVNDCSSLAQKSQKAVEKAISVAPDDPEAIRAQIDQKRLGGDVAGARKLVDRIAGIQAQPETALVLGALDLREQSPPWQSVIDRLTKASSDEGDLGRARALLVYAFARSGDVKGARAEFEKIAKLPRVHPLKAALAKLLDRADKGELPAARVDDLPSAAGSPSSSGGLSGPLPGGSSGSILMSAHEALVRHDLGRAEQLYQSVIDKEPNNTEAIAGLAAVAKEQGNLGRADALYKRSLEQNDGYIPSIASGADLKWETGQKDAAVVLYARLLELDPSGPNAERARSRIAQYNAENATRATSGSGSNPGATSGGSESSTTSGGLPSDIPLSP